ncbi:hypothetical protein SpCBS45565_g05602 [Spizellomyces sp. 'palustris']|nr:hypothetical protein SpCBS45565_g05602 [Spizellomyces sp. 'palustris']
MFNSPYPQVKGATSLRGQTPFDGERVHSPAYFTPGENFSPRRTQSPSNGHAGSMYGRSQQGSQHQYQHHNNHGSLYENFHDQNGSPPHQSATYSQYESPYQQPNSHDEHELAQHQPGPYAEQQQRHQPSQDEGPKYVPSFLTEALLGSPKKRPSPRLYQGLRDRRRSSSGADDSSNVSTSPRQEDDYIPRMSLFVDGARCYGLPYTGYEDADVHSEPTSWAENSKGSKSAQTNYTQRGRDASGSRSLHEEGTMLPDTPMDLSPLSVGSRSSVAPDTPTPNPLGNTVTVLGSRDVDLLLQEFSNLGRIISHKKGRNWIVIRYADHSAVRAALRHDNTLWNDEVLAVKSGDTVNAYGSGIRSAAQSLSWPIAIPGAFDWAVSPDDSSANPPFEHVAARTEENGLASPVSNDFVDNGNGVAAGAEQKYQSPAPRADELLPVTPPKHESWPPVYDNAHGNRIKPGYFSDGVLGYVYDFLFGS